MKAKRFNKKLVLNKKTIADLSIDEMNAAHGGVTTSGCTLKVTCSVPTGPNCGPTRETFCCVIC